MARGRVAICLAALTGLLAACQTDQQAVNVPPPADTRARIVAAKGQLWKDPDSIKSASIGGLKRHMGFMWHVCVRANAKNAFGGYTGEQNMLIGLYDDSRPPEVIMSNVHSSYCEEPFEPFPELEGGYKPPPQAAPKAKPKA